MDGCPLNRFIYIPSLHWLFEKKKIKKPLFLVLKINNLKVISHLLKKKTKTKHLSDALIESAFLLTRIS